MFQFQIIIMYCRSACLKQFRPRSRHHVSLGHNELITTDICFGDMISNFAKFFELNFDTFYFITRLLVLPEQFHENVSF